MCIRDRLRGFKAINPTNFQIINLDQLQKLNKSKVDLEVLEDAGLVKPKKPVKLLSDGVISLKMSVSVHAASQKAIESVKKAGGEVVLINTDKKKPNESKPKISKKE